MSPPVLHDIRLTNGLRVRAIVGLPEEHRGFTRDSDVDSNGTPAKEVRSADLGVRIYWRDNGKLADAQDYSVTFVPWTSIARYDERTLI